MKEALSDMKMKKIVADCNLDTIKDQRGAIFSYIPKKPIYEWTHQFINKGKVRGNHFHPEFDEYILIVSGSGMEVEKDIETSKENKIYLAKGDCVYIPKNTYHVFLAITDCESVSFLTKRWDDCKNPIIHENIGYGVGDHGDPNSEYYQDKK